MLVSRESEAEPGNQEAIENPTQARLIEHVLDHWLDRFWLARRLDRAGSGSRSAAAGLSANHAAGDRRFLRWRRDWFLAEGRFPDPIERLDRIDRGSDHPADPVRSPRQVQRLSMTWCRRGLLS